MLHGPIGDETDKDAADIHRLVISYADAGNTDRLYEHEMELLTAGFDMQVADAELLGREVAHLSLPSALARVRSVLESERTRERLLAHMVRTSTVAEDMPFVERLLDSFRRGILTNK